MFVLQTQVHATEYEIENGRQIIYLSVHICITKELVSANRNGYVSGKKEQGAMS